MTLQLYLLSWLLTCFFSQGSVVSLNGVKIRGGGIWNGRVKGDGLRVFSGVNVADSHYIIRSDTKDDESRTRLQASFRNNNGVPRFVFRQLSQLRDGKGFSSKASFASRTCFFRLIEFNNTIGVYDSTNVFKFSDYADGIQHWTSFKSPTGFTNSTVDGVNVKIATTSMAFNQHPMWASLNVTIRAYMSEQPIQAFTDQQHESTGTEGVVLDPSSIKWSVIIRDFPFVMQNSQLALVMGFFQKEKVSYSNSNSSSIDLGAGGQFSWNSSVVADGQLASVFSSEIFVNSTINADSFFEQTNGDEVDGNVDEFSSESQLVAFVFPQARNLIWDPTLTVVDTSQTSSAQSIRTFSSTAAFLGCLSVFAIKMMF